ncbi:theronine dehydrogenase-like Zn-dependent dehydrogenase [Sphaerochaeta pleomorpha str. Grapes]|uniref:Theronine dehydrogenase-like Zn-dependent dehydrogenase n=1 Tax=Sphaerochaeta pleomorpha (strain ATCC BAA-1885 / DSM 22778 / Grapes) TaxID=158190 RepID=G8QSV5_SPHPG|nr:zinc-dependent alcohol dehydrogenase family protein [Sphaerochaeta pleomorpha]AEV30137.1 theronine dehydrogenase-like Zn-dependent dehydrogenase [Sphaerochaeta pleomorpha str. Grapes]
MRAIVIEKPGMISVREVPIPVVNEDEVLIKVMSSGICGTDVHIFHGEYLGSYPIIPGHEFSGIVEKVGKQVKRIKVGDHVAVEPNIACDNCENCLENRQNFCANWQGVGVSMPGGMAEYVKAPEKAVFSIGKLPFDEGAFCEPLSCVLHGIEQVPLKLGDRVLVLGAGPIGMLLAQTAKIRGACTITQVDKNESRLEMAKAYAADVVCNDLESLKGQVFDVVIEASGSKYLLENSVHYARGGGSVLFFGVPKNDLMILLSPFEIFSKSLRIMGTYTSVRNSMQAIRLMESHQIDVRPLINPVLPLTSFNQGVQSLVEGKAGVMKVMIKPQQ